MNGYSSSDEADSDLNQTILQPASLLSFHKMTTRLAGKRGKAGDHHPRVAARRE